MNGRDGESEKRRMERLYTVKVLWHGNGHFVRL